MYIIRTCTQTSGDQKLYKQKNGLTKKKLGQFFSFTERGGGGGVDPPPPPPKKKREEGGGGEGGEN